MQEDKIIELASKQLFDEVVAPLLRASAKRWTAAIAEECAKIADAHDFGPTQHGIGDLIRARYGIKE